MYQGWAETRESGHAGRLFNPTWVTKSQLAGLLQSRDGRLHVTDTAIRHIASCRLEGKNLAWLLLRQFLSELKVRRLKQNNFRVKLNGDACKAYCAMNVRDFEGINARQWWSNWRTIPRNLSGTLPDRPLQILDLCCGIGQSTEVLAFYAAPGSEILGLEYNPQFVQQARGREYINRHGRRARVRFHMQSVLHTFRGCDGVPLADASIDWINASGAVGCHFDAGATEQLSLELARVLKPGGLAMIDIHWRKRNELELLMAARGFAMVRSARSCFFDRFVHVCFQRQ